MNKLWKFLKLQIKSERREDKQADKSLIISGLVYELKKKAKSIWWMPTSLFSAVLTKKPTSVHLLPNTINLPTFEKLPHH